MTTEEKKLARLNTAVLSDLEEEHASIRDQIEHERELVHFLVDKPHLDEIKLARLRRIERLKAHERELADKISKLKPPTVH